MKKVEDMIRQGRTIEQVQQSINMDEFKRGPWDNSIEDVQADWRLILKLS